MKRSVFGAIIVALVCLTSFGQEPLVPNYSTIVGNVKVEPVANTGVRDVPYLTWGADVALFEANGGINTTPDSIMAKHGLKYRLVNGDDFAQQVRNYMSGKTPFLRGTFTQIGAALELLNQNSATKPVMILQLSWSAGDHAVSRAHVKTLNDLKGKTICLQRGGPHEGMLNDMLNAVGMKWSDIKVIWAKNLTGEDSPAAMMRSDPSIDVAFVISPDMSGLTGGLNSKGTGAEGTIKDTHVLVSTVTMSRSIPDVMCVRKDFYSTKPGQAEAEKYLAAYLAATERLVAQKKLYADGKGKSPDYIKALKMAQQIFGEKVLPTIEVDAHGLVSDATFVGLPGQISFFNDAGNLSGFESKQKTSIDLAVLLGYAANRAGVEKASWDYTKVAKLAGIAYQEPVAAADRARIAESVESFPDDELDKRVIMTFTINFEPDQQDFSVDTWRQEFTKVIQNTQTFGNAQFVIRGHADPTLTLGDFIKAGIANKLITREGKTGSYKYYLRGKPLDLNATPSVIEAITQGQFSGTPNPQDTMQAALTLSQKRADQVKAAIVKIALESKFNLDATQIKPVGIGIREPIIPKPTNMEEARKNMRVEFKLIKVDAESIKSGDFDY